MQQSTMSWSVDSVHALLSMVPDKGTSAVEADRQPTFVPSLQMGYREGILEFLRLVQGASAA